MNVNTEPPQPPQPHRLSASCDRHPDEHFTGFCPSCLCERLAVLNTSNSASTSRKPPPIPTTSTATAALKAIFKPSSSNSGVGGGGDGSSRPSFFPELRRTKSFAALKNEGLGFSVLFEPQRKSCDVRFRNTLWSLFYQEDDQKSSKKETRGANTDNEVVDSRDLVSSSSVSGPVKEEEVEIETESQSDNEDKDNFWDSKDPNLASNVNSRSHPLNPIEHRVPEIVEEEVEKEEEPELVLEIVHEEDMKAMKDHIDLNAQAKKPSGRDFKEMAGSFWSAASVFSNKWQKWRQKQKLKKRRNDGGGCVTLPVEKPIGWQYRETQSETADYGFGRRSCDTDPRFSLDASRISFDDPRYSFDKPRASWDGYLIGRNFAANTRMPTMLSVVEDAPVHVSRSDTQIPIEEHINSTNEDGTVPGGSMQTKEYYSDSSSRRKNLDRSNSIRKTAAAVVAEMDEMESVSKAKVTPATVDYFNGLKLPDMRDSSSNSLRDDCSETFEIRLRDNASVVGNGVVGNGERKGTKKSRRWTKAWNIWGFIQWRSINKDEDDDRYGRANGVERSFSESWQELRGERDEEARGAFNPKFLRSNSSVSWRNYNGIGGSFGNLRKNGVETNGNGKKKVEFVLERNRSARYLPNDIDNGMLRFFSTPMRGSRRAGMMKSRANHAHSIARSVL
ncbi:hypothetical protein HS088_TW03G01205 [Tripterygium wilfordii]|uniref:Uncharacterized protein n=1 Tax=Tripterygium wilfordii TaxID=458696 RepID=A0A7J7DWX9_TRIWF|nr:protein OCTOPUS-like [Tripterygium wilfordii]KAF5750865.1 hypothetical protein HS088_TW03G01205 [Tripterygium wilfordii]